MRLKDSSRDESHELRGGVFIHLIIFKSIFHGIHAGVSVGAATGGAMSVLKGKVSFGTRPKDEEIEGLIKWILFGGVGIATVVLAFCCITKNCQKMETNDHVSHKSDFYWSDAPKYVEKCQEGI